MDFFTNKENSKNFSLIAAILLIVSELLGSTSFISMLLGFRLSFNIIGFLGSVLLIIALFSKKFKLNF